MATFADVRFGRYEVIKFGSIVSFLASILYYFAIITGGGDSTLSNVLLSVAFVIVWLWIHMLLSSHASLHNRSDHWCHFR